MKWWILPILLFCNCATPKIVTISSNGVTLKYTCGRFEPQARTNVEANVVLEKSVEAIMHAREVGDIGLARSLKAARDLKDIRRVEELIVTDECSR